MNICFRVLAIVNGCYEYRGVCIFENWSGYMPRSAIAGLYDISIFVFWRISILFSIVAAPAYIPPNSVGGEPTFLV